MCSPHILQGVNLMDLDLQFSVFDETQGTVGIEFEVFSCPYGVPERWLHHRDVLDIEALHIQWRY